MPASRLLTAILVFGLATFAFAEEPQFRAPENTSAKNSEQDVTAAIEQLRRAEQQLEAANEVLRQSRNAAAWTASERKAIQLQMAQVQKQLNQIREITNPAGQVAFKLRVLEVPAAAVAELMKHVDEGPAGVGPFRAIFKNTEEFDKQLAAINGLKRVSEPQLITTPGREAEMNVGGGEFPIQVPGPDNTVRVEMRKFGTMCKISYQSLDDGRIRVEGVAEISELDPANGVKLGNQTVPAVMSRRANMQADLGLGETLVMALLKAPSRTKVFAGGKATSTLFVLTPTAVKQTVGK